jgi:NhaP-type Na+/H+ and K+/H+ antiporter
VCREGWSAIASARRFAEEQQLSDTARYALVLALTSAVALGAVLVNRLSARLGVPPPVWMLAAAAVAVQLIPGMPTPPDSVVAQIVTVALVLILFDGGSTSDGPGCGQRWYR